MGSRGQSYKKQIAQLDKASERYNSLQERSDSITNVGGRFYDRTGQEVPREEVEKLSEDLTASRERFEDLRDRMIEREERRNAGRQEQAEAVDNDDVLFSNFAEQSNAQTSAERARERAAKRQATRDRQTARASRLAGRVAKRRR